MKNLFSFAKKELSQDAFLRWLIENFNCEDKQISSLALDLLSNFTQKQILNKTQITNLKTYSQYKKIDIVIEFDFNNSHHCIAIEDKTESCEHNQLNKYNTELAKKFNNHNIYKIYFKTSLLSDDEKNRVSASNWKIYDINKIYSIFCNDKYKSTTNQILCDYINHIKQIYFEIFDFKNISFNNWPYNNTIFMSYTKQELNFKYDIWQGRYVYAYNDKRLNSITIRLCFEFRGYKIISRIIAWSDISSNENIEHLKSKLNSNNLINNLNLKIRKNKNSYRFAYNSIIPQNIKSYFEFDNWVKDKISLFDKLAEFIKINI